MTSEKNENHLTTEQYEALMETLKDRFHKHMNRHQELDWNNVQVKIDASPKKARSLYEMEQTGGEPDVVDYDETTDEYIIFDCSPESPTGRRSVCYDLEGLLLRKKHPPKNNAIDMAEAMEIKLLTEVEYRHLQELGSFDAKTSSWIQTPASIRELGGALFCDRRYNHVFLYHNGASSYYAARGFRGSLRI